MPATVTERDGRVARGNRTRRAILQRAVDVASVEGLDALTIGRLAAESAASKSGVFAHFGSKEDLQLATVEAARGIFIERVVDPSRRAPEGLRRLWAMCGLWLEYASERVFPGGCFFAAAAAEFDARPGRVRDAVAAAVRDWVALLESEIARARDLGELDASTDPRLLAFELDALATSANTRAQLQADIQAFALARAAMRDRLSAAATDARLLPPK